MKPRVLLALPTTWDLLELRHRQDAAYELLPLGPLDDDIAWDWDWAAWLDAAAREHAGAVDGVLSSGDYPGCILGALLARRLGLPGPDPAALLRASHKLASREVQARAAPDATPRFAAVDPDDPRVPAELGYPCFVKPIKSSFSMFARLVRSEAELRAHVARPLVREFLRHFPHIFNQLLRAHGPADVTLDASRLIAEAPLGGEQVTLEGFVHEGRVEVLAVVDSIVHPVNRSFLRFDLPSRLPAAAQARLADVCARAVRALGLDGTLFNVELFWDPAAERASIIEVNTRMCGQFADLYEKVLGTSGYEVACALATGERPRVRGEGPHRVAASVPLRTFEPARVARGPSADDVRAAEALFPGTRVWTLATTGQVLDEFERAEDGASQLYAVVNVGGDDADDLARRVAAVTARLGYVLTPLRPLAPRRPAA